ncbi:MAG: hypothetical protein QOK25_140 [Thermoleophilaceae bacterium]|jgi:hypothetical protein|nr:hypothetical protein [Thermoleophilaceae bacterium]
MTFELEKTGAKLALVGLVLIAGALGGFAAELLKVRKVDGQNEEGVWEGWRRLTNKYYDLGTPASLFLGMIAAALAMGIFSPIDEVAKGTAKVHQYDLWRVVALTLTAGFSAPKFLATAQERLLALVTQTRFQSALESAQQAAQQAPAADPQHKTVEAIVNKALAPQ